MKKSELISRTHSDYNKMIAAMANALDAINEARDLIGTMDPPSAGTILINLKSMTSELGNMSAAIAKDYLEELECHRKKED